jgi:hypothetical protein
MEIARETADTLTRYFLNASPFLWGVLGARKKKERIIEIKGMGFLENYSETSKQKYDTINQELLVELGIEGIIGRIVVPIIYKRLGSEALTHFRRHWEQGQLPDKKYLKDNKLYRHRRAILYQLWEENRMVPEKDPAFIFLEINESLDFVDRWTVFAGLWFEIIDPLITKEEKEKLEKAYKGIKEGS